MQYKSISPYYTITECTITECYIWLYPCLSGGKIYWDSFVRSMGHILKAFTSFVSPVL